MTARFVLSLQLQIASDPSRTRDVSHCPHADFVDDAVLEQAEGFRDSFYTDVRSRSPPRNRAENSNPNDIAITPNDTAVRVAIPDAVLERYRHGNDKVHMS
mmetsp:Transcript_8780/g.27648  ORF Transcript_8780/g.27648 Transcript_8780/m.27648 type:complete len:101 (+) Transcript_8780:764-1066(+)